MAGQGARNRAVGLFIVPEFQACSLRVCAVRSLQKAEVSSYSGAAVDMSEDLKNLALVVIVVVVVNVSLSFLGAWILWAVIPWLRSL